MRDDDSERIDPAMAPVPAPAGEPRRSAAQMIDECFRHQHPEAYGREQVAQVAIPWDLECGRDHMMSSQACAVAEEPMGSPNAVPLDTS